jgi:hypothetical protein
MLGGRFRSDSKELVSKWVIFILRAGEHDQLPGFCISCSRPELPSGIERLVWLRAPKYAAMLPVLDARVLSV